MINSISSRLEYLIIESTQGFKNFSQLLYVGITILYFIMLPMVRTNRYYNTTQRLPPDTVMLTPLSKVTGPTDDAPYPAGTV